MTKPNKSKKKNNKTVEIPILNTEYKAVVCWGTPEYVAKVGRDYWYDDVVIKLKEDNRGTTWSNPKCHPIIVLPGYPKTPVEIGTLSHEACHAVHDILERIGAAFEYEIVAHSVGAIVRMVLEKGKL